MLFTMNITIKIIEKYKKQKINNKYTIQKYVEKEMKKTTAISKKQINTMF